jgi:hypothetical protein
LAWSDVFKFISKFFDKAQGICSSGAPAGDDERLFFLSPEQLKTVRVPEECWFRQQRGAVGCEAWLYAMLDIAAADEILQYEYGFDETCLDRQSTMNQWALTREDGELSVMAVEAGGIMVGGTAKMMAAHTLETWRRRQVPTQEGVNLVRAALVGIGGLELADRLAPMVNGGVRLHKARSIFVSDAVHPPPPFPPSRSLSHYFDCLQPLSFRSDSHLLPLPVLFCFLRGAPRQNSRKTKSLMSGKEMG